MTKESNKKKSKDKPGPEPERLIIDEDPKEALRRLLRVPDPSEEDAKDFKTGGGAKSPILAFRIIGTALSSMKTKMANGIVSLLVTQNSPSRLTRLNPNLKRFVGVTSRTGSEVGA